MQLQKSVFYTIGISGQGPTMLDLFDSIVFKDTMDYATQSTIGISYLSSDTSVIERDEYVLNIPLVVQPYQIPTLSIANKAGASTEVKFNSGASVGYGITITPTTITNGSFVHQNYIIKNNFTFVNSDGYLSVSDTGNIWTIDIDDTKLGKVRLIDANSSLAYLGDILGNGLYVNAATLDVKYQDGISTTISDNENGIKCDLLYNISQFEINGSNELELIDFATLTHSNDDEVITQTWEFQKPVIGVAPIADTDLSTKKYVDDLVDAEVLAINTTLTDYSTTVETQALIDASILAADYDSGWIDLPGFTYLTGTRKPQFRTINRLIMYRGDIVIPIDDGAGVLEASIATYKNLKKVTPWEGTGGVTIDGDGFIYFNENNTIMPSLYVYPDKEVTKSVIGTRLLVSDNDATVWLDYTMPCDITLTTDGKIYISLIKSIEKSTADADDVPQMYPLRAITSNCRTTKYALDYNTCFTDADANDGANNMVIIGSAFQHSCTINATNPSYVGGFIINIDNLYATISSSYTLDEIYNGLNIV